MDIFQCHCHQYIRRTKSLPRPRTERAGGVPLLQQPGPGRHPPTLRSVFLSMPIADRRPHLLPEVHCAQPTRKKRNKRKHRQLMKTQRIPSQIRRSNLADTAGIIPNWSPNQSRSREAAQRGDLGKQLRFKIRRIKKGIRTCVLSDTPLDAASLR